MKILFLIILIIAIIIAGMLLELCRINSKISRQEEKNKK